MRIYVNKYVILLVISKKRLLQGYQKVIKGIAEVRHDLENWRLMSKITQRNCFEVAYTCTSVSGRGLMWLALYIWWQKYWVLKCSFLTGSWSSECLTWKLFPLLQLSESLILLTAQYVREEFNAGRTVCDTGVKDSARQSWTQRQETTQKAMNNISWFGFLKCSVTTHELSMSHFALQITFVNS